MSSEEGEEFNAGRRPLLQKIVEVRDIGTHYGV